MPRTATRKQIKMKDKKHFLHHDSVTAAPVVVSSPSSSSPPLYPSLHNHPNPNLAPPHHFNPSPAPNPTDGATVELPRRRRGRPPGSKNKPKPPSSSLVSPSSASASASLSLSPNSIPYPQPSMRTLLLQIDPDNDVVDSVTRFCRNNSVSISILSASGTLSHFTLRHPSSPPSNLTFRGRFDILSISATIVTESGPLSESRSNPSSFYLPSGFTVTVSAPQGQVVGGVVGGPLIAAGPVFIVVASLGKPTYHRLPEINDEEEVDDEKRQTAGGGGIFGCNMGGSDGVWGPVAARQPY